MLTEQQGLTHLGTGSFTGSRLASVRLSRDSSGRAAVAIAAEKKGRQQKRAGERQRGQSRTIGEQTETKRSELGRAEWADLAYAA
jgi:hypothetical protein